jgi:hypothetical protein
MPLVVSNSDGFLATMAVDSRNKAVIVVSSGGAELRGGFREAKRIAFLCFSDDADCLTGIG